MRKVVYLLCAMMLLLVAACSSTPQAVEPTAAPAAAGETTSEEAAPAEEAATEAPVEEAATEAGDLAAPVEYPEGQVLAGSREPVTFAMDEIIRFGTLPEYCEPEWVSALVAEGKLPPVEERLPNEPGIYQSTLYSDGPGEYGGIWRGVWAVPIEGWNYNAGAVQGWFGIEAIVQEEPFATGPMFLTEDVQPIPFLARSYEWNDDNTVLTVNLLEGAKWSDGDEFTSEDVMFLWEDNIHDPNVTTWTGPSYWTVNGEPITLEAPDDYTLVFTLPEPSPKFLYNLTSLNFSPGPAHILKPHHPSYGGTDYQSYRDSLAAGALPVVTMGPWVPVEYTTDEFLLMRRNPYYYKVDSNGCQLPYLDEVQWTYSTTGATRTLNTIAGTADHSNVENIETMDETVRQAQNPDATFRVEWGPETLGFNVEFNQSATLGVADDREASVRELLRNPDFRKAFAYAVDRDGLARSMTNGPFFRAWAGGLFPGSAYFDRESVVYYPYSPESANALLDSMGLVDTDGNGVRNFASGPAAGQDIIIGFNTGEDNTAGQSLGPAIVAFLGEVGIQLNLRTLAGTVMTDVDRSGAWELRIGRPGQAWATPNIRCLDIAPGRADFSWHRVADQSAEGEYADYEQRMIEISNEFCLEPDFDAEFALMSELNQLHTENTYSLGLITGRYGLMLNKNLKNVPIGTPAFLYQWDFNNFLAEQLWFEAEHRSDQGQSEIYPETVPYFEDCNYAGPGTACVVGPGE